MTISKISSSRTLNKGAREEKKRGAPLPVSFINLEGVLWPGALCMGRSCPHRNTSSAYEYERTVVTASERMLLSKLLKVLGQLKT